MDILAALQEEKDALSRSEQRIAELLFAETEFAVNASIIELAARAEVSPPTVTRFCRRLGCQSFSEFKVRLAQSTYVGRRYLTPDNALGSTTEVIERVMSQAQTALYTLNSTLNPDLLDKAAELVAGAGMIHAFGSGGNSSMIAAEIENRLFRLGLRVGSCADHNMQMMQAAAAQPGDVVIASSLSGRNLELARALAIAGEYKITTIALTRPGTPVAEAARLVLPVDIGEGTNILRPTSARFAFLATVDILATLVAMRRGEAARETLRRVKHQMVTFRDPDDKEVLGD